MNEKGLGMRLQKARQAAGLTQQELCQKSGLSYSTLAKIERGAIKSPSIFTVQQIAAVLGTTVDELLGAPSLPVTSEKQTSKSGVKFVYFDIHGCIVQFFHRAFAAVAKDVGISSDIVETTYWHYNDAVCRGDLTIEDFNQALAKQFRVPSIDWTTYYLEAIDGIEETHDLIKWASKHYKVGLLSNIMPGMVEVMRREGLIPDIEFDAIIDSSVVKTIKPETKIYEIAQAKTGCSPEEILFVDDSRANLMAAERQGWKVIWFDDYRPKESTERIKQTLSF